MKKSSAAVIGVVCILGVLGLVFLGMNILKMDFNKMGTEKYYTKITGTGSKITNFSTNGEKIDRYEYDLASYSEEGEENSFSFTAAKQLREDAYLLLYVKKDKGVTSYEEVQKEQLPDAVKDKI